MDIEKQLEKFPLEEHKKEMDQLQKLIGKAMKEPACIEARMPYDMETSWRHRITGY